MAEAGRDGSPGRQRRSTERSRENIREYVKLLSRKVSSSPSSHRTPRLHREAKTPEGTSASKSKVESGNTSLVATKKKNATPSKKSPKTKRNWSSPNVSTETETSTTDKEKNEKTENKSKAETSKKVSMPTLKSARTPDKPSEPSTSKKLTKSVSIDSSLDTESDLDTISCYEDYDDREEMEVHQKSTEGNKINSPDTNVKRTKPGRGVDKSDSPPDLVLFLKEGRGRAQNYSEPPTLESETIATRRRTRVPTDPKSIVISKKVGSVQTKAKKDLKGIPKKETKREKLKVLETPESLKRLAQGVPLKDQSKSVVTLKQETPKVMVEGKPKKRNMLKDLAEKSIKHERISTPVSEEDSQESEDGRRRRGRRRGNSSESTSSLDDSQPGSSKLPQSILDDSENSVYLNVDSVLQQVPGSMVDEKVPHVIMSNSDQEDNTPVKAMPKSRKNQSSSEEKAKTRAFMKMASSSTENSPVSEDKDREDKEDSDSFIRLKDTPTLPKNTKPASTTMKNKSVKKNTKTGSLKGSVGVHDKKINEGTFKAKIHEEAESSSSKAKTENSDSKGSGGIKSLSTLNRVSGVVKSSELIKICPPVKRDNKQTIKSSPLMVRVSDLISLNMGNKTIKPALAGNKFNIKMPSVDSGSSSGIAKATAGLETYLIKGDGTTIPKTFIKVGEIAGQERYIIPSSSTSQKLPVIDYTDIDTQEVVVGGEIEDQTTPSLMVGHLPEDIDLRANEELGSSSEDETAKSPEPRGSTKREALSPEGKVALDHSYSSGSSEGGKVVATPKKKTPVSCEKPLTSRPVYSSASLAKRSLDIMLHNDKINILRQMSQIFNDEKPVQTEKEQPQTVSSSEGEGEEDIKTIKEKVADQPKIKSTDEVKKEDKFSLEGIIRKDEQTSKISNQVLSKVKPSSSGSNQVPSVNVTKKGQIPAKANSECINEKEQVDKVKAISKKQELVSSLPSQNQKGDISGKEEHTAASSNVELEDPKVHHVPFYSLLPDELISVQSSIGPDGEHVDIVDGFTFVSLNTLEELNTYTQKRGGKIDKRHCPWLKRKKRRKKLLKLRKKVEGAKSPDLDQQEPSVANEEPPENCSIYNSGAFASNDLDTYLNNNAHLNISYAIPKCKATEDGVTKMRDDELLETLQRAEPPASHSESVKPIESEPSEPKDNEGNTQAADIDPLQYEQLHQYEEVNAVDILYPREKYKYYYNKDLCKETKADGSNVFVRRAGKLVPLMSVFKNQKMAAAGNTNKKTAELVYVYDGGKLLTLGGSLTKINPSNSDSVRARVILPIGVPPIIKGDIGQNKTKKVEAVEINEDLAKFALSALQSPEVKEVKPLEEKEAKAESQKSEPSGDKIEEKKENIKKKMKEPLKITKVKPTKGNILDIIAAKLAMDDGESDKDDDNKESTTPKNEEPFTKGIEKTEENKAGNGATDIKEVNDKGSDGKMLTEFNNTKINLENSDDVKPKSDNDSEEIKCEGETSISSKPDKKEEDQSTAVHKQTGDNQLEEGEFKRETETINADVKEIDTNLTNANKDSEDGHTHLNETSEHAKDPEDIQDGNNMTLIPEEKIKEETNKDAPEDPSQEEPNVDARTERSGSSKEEADGKSRTFKKNMYRFPSLSREMKRLNMNFVNYTVEESTQEDESIVEKESKEACTHEHCLLGCVCDTLSCRRRDPEHCGRVECMFECNCHDETWKHAVSGVGRTMNAVSIFNLDREQKEGLALREKDFKKTVIQTGSEVILVGAERKKRERRIPGRYRDSAVWMGGDLVDMDCTTLAPETEVAQEPVPEYPSIPLSEANKYIKKCKITIPWYKVKGISVWCMDHSCYDCKCLTDENFYKDIIEKVSPEKKVPKTPPAIESFEEVLKQKANSGLGILSPQHDIDGMMWEGRCVVVNINVNNTEAKRKYSWKLKEWYHPRGMHSARTIGYLKKNMIQETKHLTLTGLSSQESTPEQVVENVVRSLKDPRTKLFVPALANIPKSPGTPECMEVVEPKVNNTPVPVVDLTASSVGEKADIMPVLEPKEKSQSELYPLPEKDLQAETTETKKRRASESLDILPDSPKKVFRPGSHDAVDTPRSVHKDERGQETNKSVLKPGLQKQDKFPYRKPVSLLEMMIAEEKRGELELDLTNNFPGNAMLVAEARFRKLINMNIIGVIGINKSGRCILATVDSIESMRVMQRIHSMISNNNLDVGPNMREIFFPPPHTVSRPRFVMIRCDGNAKWEIVGVVQKKGPYVASKSGETKSKTVPKPGPSVPQIVDLEEEERQKEKAKQKPDIVILADSENNENEGTEKEGGTWEGNLPLIASVHSAADANMADFLDLKDAAFSTLESGTPEGVLSPRKDESSNELNKMSEDTGANIANPIKKALTPEIEVSPSLVKKPLVPDTKSATLMQKKVKTLPDLVPITEPTEGVERIGIALSENTNKNISTGKHLPVSSGGTVHVSKMKTIKLNQSSSRVFGDAPVIAPSSVQLPVNSSQIIVTSSTPSSSVKSPPGNAEIVKSLSHPGSSTDETDSSVLLEKRVDDNSVQCKEEKPTSPLSIKVNPLPSPPLENTLFRPCIQVAHTKGTSSSLLPRIVSPVSPRMLYIPVSSSNMSKMVLMPSGSSGPSRMVFMSPASKTASGVLQEGGKMKMVLVPSPSEKNKMLILPPHSKDTSVAGLPVSASAEIEKKLILMQSSQAVNLIGSQDDQPTSYANIPEVNLEENADDNKEENTSAVPAANTKAKDPNQDDSDDVVVIGTSSNTITIRRVRSSTESSESVDISTAPSIDIVPAATSVISSSGNAQTAVVSSVSTISSTLPQASHTTSKDCDIINPSGDGLKGAEDMVIVKTSLNENQLNTLLKNTHRDMLKTASASDATQIQELSNSGQDKKGVTEINRSKKDQIQKAKELSSEKGNIKSSHSQPRSKKVPDIQELESHPVPIKKMGYHWSAVDLSLNFKSVKLEWLLGTIRKNVLVNIFRMSQKTLSPVTLSVKNGSSTSMLYGLARRGVGKNKQPLTILILGSIVSAVLSSVSTSDDTLFQGNAVKYFIRESTGELSSYTYDASGEYLVKLASKKRGHGGEMIGIGERVPLHRMRELNHSAENLLVQSPEKESQPSKKTLSEKKANDSATESAHCNCTAAGDFICHGHSTPDSASTSQHESTSPKSALVESINPESKNIQVPKSTNSSSVSPIPSTSSSKVSAEGISNTESLHESSNKSSHQLSPPSATGKNEESTHSKESENCSKQKVNAPDTALSKGTDDVHLVYESKADANPEKAPEINEADEMEDVDIEGEAEQELPILMQLREQVAAEAGYVRRTKGSHTTPGEIARRLLNMSETAQRTGIKRKADTLDHRYERPCPRSKKKLHQNIILASTTGSTLEKDHSLQAPEMQDSQDSWLAQMRAISKGTMDLEPRPGPSGVKRPLKTKQINPVTHLKAKKDPLRIQKKFSDIEGTGEERNSVVHNELERMRRRLMKRLFQNLQYWSMYTPGQSFSDLPQNIPKVAVLSVATKVCKEMVVEEERLTAQEEEVRAVRSVLIKKLASVIADQGEEVKMFWKQWVRTNMKYPVTRILFEKNWKPSEVDKDVLSISSTESSLDLDLDDGSPLSAPSSPGESLYTALISRSATGGSQPTQVNVDLGLEAHAWDTVNTYN